MGGEVNQPTMQEAYTKAVRIIGDQAVQLALLGDRITELEARAASEDGPPADPSGPPGGAGRTAEPPAGV